MLEASCNSIGTWKRSQLTTWSFLFINYTNACKSWWCRARIHNSCRLILSTQFYLPMSFYWCSETTAFYRRKGRVEMLWLNLNAKIFDVFRSTPRALLHEPGKKSSRLIEKCSISGLIRSSRQDKLFSLGFNLKVVSIVTLWQSTLLVVLTARLDSVRLDVRHRHSPSLRRSNRETLRRAPRMQSNVVLINF